MFDRIINRIRQIKHDLTANREADATRIALDQIALTKLRIQTTGQNSENQPFSPYVPSYAKQRQKAGYQVGYVDFTRSGRMWAAVRPFVVKSSVFSATIEIRGADQRAQDIIAGARAKRGNILRPSQQEIELSREANRQRVLKYFEG